MTIAVIGLGLIGGSLALSMRKKGLPSLILGVDNSPANAQEALDRKIVDKIVDIQAALAVADIIILAIPVDASNRLLEIILNNISNTQVVMDVGSNKAAICQVANSSSKRARFVPTHPMWGTEYSGPKAATVDAFEGQAVVICDRHASANDALDLVKRIYQEIGMHILYMDSSHHDMHVAYVSHISHISSFALSNTVLEKEKQESTILELASSGFGTTVRLAKSNVDTWAPVLIENRIHILDVLNEYMLQLSLIRKALEQEDTESLKVLITKSNVIKKILK